MQHVVDEHGMELAALQGAGNDVSELEEVEDGHIDEELEALVADDEALLKLGGGVCIDGDASMRVSGGAHFEDESDSDADEQLFGDVGDRTRAVMIEVESTPHPGRTAGLAARGGDRLHTAASSTASIASVDVQEQEEMELLEMVLCDHDVMEGAADVGGYERGTLQDLQRELGLRDSRESDAAVESAIGASGDDGTASDSQFTFFLWDGECLYEEERDITPLPVVALYCANVPANAESVYVAETDTTGANEGVFVDDLVLLAASCGSNHCLVRREDVASFIYTHHAVVDVDEGHDQARHSGCVFVSYDSARSFEVLEKWLRAAAEEDCADWLWEIVHIGHWRDAGILDMLIGLALRDADPDRQPLPDLVGRYLVMQSHSLVSELQRPNEYEHQYATLLELNGGKWYEEGVVGSIFEMLVATIRIPIAVSMVYEKMCMIAKKLSEDHRDAMAADAIDRFGYFTEVIQVKASFAARAMWKNGMVVDLRRLERVREKLVAQMQEDISAIADMKYYSDLFLLPVQTDVPRKKRLEMLLIRVTREVQKNHDVKIELPLNERGQLSLSTKKWKQHEKYHPFLKHWISMQYAAKLRQYTQVHVPVARSTYRPLVRNGRTSCSDPCIQQMPRAGGFREAFRARDGHVFLICDYSFIELCTLSVVCEKKFGFSMLASVIRKGIDPHCFTAAMFEGVTLEEFMELKKSEETRARFKALRQRAKAINFGIPGGEGALALQEYAQSAYGVTLTLEESKTFRERLIREVYPELGLYLFEDCMDVLAARLQVPVAKCWRRFVRKGPWKIAIGLAIRNIVEGKQCRSDGKPYRIQFMSSVFRGLKALNKNPLLADHIHRVADRSLAILASRTVKARKKNKGAPCAAELEGPIGDPGLCKLLFGNDVCTVTGRVRGGVTFTQGCNTPFSGLAADGAKLAMFNLMHIGYRVVAFIHDEVVVEVPESSDLDTEARIMDRVMCESMESVTKDIPIKCEYAASRVWSKLAEPVFDDRGRLVLWEPQAGELDI